MTEALGGYLAVVALAVLLIGAVTMVALRRPTTPAGGGVAAPSYALWFGVLLVVVLVARGSLSAAGVLLVGVVVYAVVVRMRLVRGGNGTRR